MKPARDRRSENQEVGDGLDNGRPLPRPQGQGEAKMNSFGRMFAAQDDEAHALRRRRKTALPPAARRERKRAPELCARRRKKLWRVARRRVQPLDMKLVSGRGTPAAASATADPARANSHRCPCHAQRRADLARAVQLGVRGASAGARVVPTSCAVPATIAIVRARATFTCRSALAPRSPARDEESSDRRHDASSA